ncbi:MAG: glycosyltransferase [Ignavibacteria bacterium]
MEKGQDNHPLVSIIIPTLNEEKLISQTLSQFTPSLKSKYNFEIIISDGGSADSTLSLVKTYADKVLVSKPNEKQNISIGRNMGASFAKGNLLYFMNADTRIMDVNYFFKVTSEIFENDSIAALTFKIKIFPEEEKLSDKLFHFCYNNYVYLLNKLGMGMGRGECQIVRKDIFLKAGGYNEAIAAGEDYDLYRRIKKIGRVKYLRDITIYESPRRFRRYGYLNVFRDWTKNSFSIFFKNKSVSKDWKEVR